MELEEMLADLNRAGLMSHDELGEYWCALVELCELREFGSDSFQRAILKEVRIQYHALKTEFKIMKEKVSNTYEIDVIRHISEVD